MNDEKERLEHLETILANKDRKGNRLCWIRWDPNSRFGYEIEDAREEIRWMVYEIKKLRKENAELLEFVDKFRNAVEDSLK